MLKLRKKLRSKNDIIAKKEELEKTLSMINKLLLEDYNSVDKNKGKSLELAYTG